MRATKRKALSYPADKVRAEMASRQITVEVLAVRSGKSKNTITQVRQGRPVSTATLAAVLRHLGLEIEFRPAA